MRIISPKSVKQWVKEYPDAAGSLKAWLRASQKAIWKSIEDVREIYPHADPVRVESASTVTVFNIGGNRYRLVTAIHYNRQVIYTLCFVTHAVYSKDRWKDNL